MRSVLATQQNPAFPHGAAYEVGKPPWPCGTDHHNLLAYWHGMVVRLARLRHESRFILKQTPGMVGAYLVASSGDADDPATVREFQHAFCLVLAFQGKSFFERRVLPLIQ